MSDTTPKELPDGNPIFEGRMDPPEWDTWNGTTTPYRGQFISTVNTIEYYESELVELDGRTREVFTGHRHVVKDVWTYFIHDGIAANMFSMAIDVDTLPQEYPTEAAAIEAAKAEIDATGPDQG